VSISLERNDGRFKKGLTPWNKGKKLNLDKYPNYAWKGRHRSIETREKISKTLKLKHFVPPNAFKSDVYERYPHLRELRRQQMLERHRLDPTFAVRMGKKGGPIGGVRVHILHPELKEKFFQHNRNLFVRIKNSILRKSWDKKHPLEVKQRIENLIRWRKEHPDFQRKVAINALHSLNCGYTKPQMTLVRKLARFFKLGCLSEKQAKILRKFGYDLKDKQDGDFYLEYPFSNRFRLDIAFPSSKVDIECDGTYWHKDKKRDQRRDKIIQGYGWKVLRFPELYVCGNLEDTVETIEEVLACRFP